MPADHGPEDQGRRVKDEPGRGQDKARFGPLLLLGENGDQVDERRKDIKDEGDREEGGFGHVGLLKDSMRESNSA